MCLRRAPEKHIAAVEAYSGLSRRGSHISWRAGSQVAVRLSPLGAAIALYPHKRSQ
jgi:hypothetical protein